VDDFFSAIDSRLQSLLPSFESSVLSSVLAIPKQVVLSTELQHAQEVQNQTILAATKLTPEQEEEEKRLEKELAQLHVRVATAAKLNRELRTQLALFQQDADTYAAHEELFALSKRQEQHQTKVLSDLTSVTHQIGELRPLGSALSSQFSEVFGVDSAAELTASNPASASGVEPSSVTQQINLAALSGGEPTININTSGAGATSATDATATGNSSASHAAKSTTASSMNIEEDAASTMF